MEITLDCIRGIQAGEYFYSANLRFKELSKMFTFIEDKTQIPPEQRAQREISRSRIKGIVTYIQNTPKYILPSIIAELEGECIKFESFDPNTTKANVAGRLIITSDELIEVLDGQHRLGSINQIINEESEYEEECINVVIYKFISLKISQQRFSDINGKSKKTSINLNLTYDDNDPIASSTLRIIRKIEPLYRKVELEHSSPKKNKLFCLKDFYNANKLIHRRHGKNISYTKLCSLVDSYWQIVNEKMEDWQKVYQGKETIENTKTFTIASHSIVITALGIVGCPIINEASAFKKEEAHNFIANKLVNLDKINFDKNNPFINDICFKRSKIVNNRETKKLLAEYIEKSLNS